MTNHHAHPCNWATNGKPFFKEGTSNELRLDCADFANMIEPGSSADVPWRRRRVLVRCSASAGMTWLPRKTEEGKRT